MKTVTTDQYHVCAIVRTSPCSAIVRTSPRATHVACAGDLVPAGAMFVTPPLETPTVHATVDAITHVYGYVEYSVLTMQLPQYCTCKTKHFLYTIVPTPHQRKQLHESEYNSHESKMVPNTNSVL